MRICVITGGTGGIGLSRLTAVLQGGQLLQKHPGALQADTSGGDKAHVVPRQHHRADGQPVRGIAAGDHRLHRLAKGRLKVGLDALAELLQGPAAVLPMGAAFIDTLHPPAHAVAVGVDHSDEVVCSGQFLKLGGKAPVLRHFDPPGHPARGHGLPLRLLHAEGRAAERRPPQGFLPLQRGGEGL